MKVLYAGKNINHHQVPFVLSLMNLLGKDNVRYASLKMIEKERLSMGFEQYSGQWLIDINQDYDLFQKWWYESDVVITNVRDFYSLIDKRINQKGLVFFTSERWFKEPEGLLRLLHPKILNLLIKFKRMSSSSYLYYLPQGFFAYKDLSQFGIFKGKSFNFGYLTPKDSFAIIDSNYNRLPLNKINILWAGSIIKLKRVDLLVRAFIQINNEFPNTYLTILGEGSEKNKIESLLSHNLDSNCYNLGCFVDNKALREIMREADIYVFPSNGAEGWGAVVNEAMSESCAIVLSNKTGATSMIKDGVNGLLFKNGSVNSLYDALRKLCSNKDYLESIKRNARNTIEEEWNSDVAAYRFLDICNNLIVNPNYAISNIEILKRL